MTQALTKSEERLFVIRPEWSDLLLPICEALKLSGFETSVIADIMQNLQKDPELPARFSIVNNKYLVHSEGKVYDLRECKEVDPPVETKKMALTFWI